MDAALRLLRETITHPWESVDQVLREHGGKALGDPETPSTGAWHLRHIVEIFRKHVEVTTRAHLKFPPDIPPDPVHARHALLKDVDLFIEWVGQQPLSRRQETIEYGGPHSVEAMIGVMSRHIVWHAAAVHYWCKWKLTPQTETPHHS